MASFMLAFVISMLTLSTSMVPMPKEMHVDHHQEEGCIEKIIVNQETEEKKNCNNDDEKNE